MVFVNMSMYDQAPVSISAWADMHYVDYFLEDDVLIAFFTKLWYNSWRDVELLYGNIDLHWHKQNMIVVSTISYCLDSFILNRSILCGYGRTPQTYDVACLGCKRFLITTSSQPQIARTCSFVTNNDWHYLHHLPLLSLLKSLQPILTIK